jgi:6-phosphofructokinase 1
MVVKRRIEKSPDAIRLGGVSHQVAAQIEGLINIECRVTILGHLLRGGSPSAFDRILATRLGCEAVHLVARGEFNRMVSVQGNDLSSVPINQVAGKIRRVTADHQWVKAAESIGLCLGLPTDMPLEKYVAGVEQTQ